MDPLIRAKCQSHGPPKGRVRSYVRSEKPLDYPSHAVICYMRNCPNPALIWLDDVAASAYDKGERLFLVMGSAVKVKLL